MIGPQNGICGWISLVKSSEKNHDGGLGCKFARIGRVNLNSAMLWVWLANCVQITSNGGSGVCLGPSKTRCTYPLCAHPCACCLWACCENKSPGHAGLTPWLKMYWQECILADARQRQPRSMFDSEHANHVQKNMPLLGPSRFAAWDSRSRGEGKDWANPGSHVVSLCTQLHMDVHVGRTITCLCTYYIS